MFSLPRYPLSGGPIPANDDRLNRSKNSKLAQYIDKKPKGWRTTPDRFSLKWQNFKYFVVF
jgi:hypothetical protein